MIKDKTKNNNAPSDENNTNQKKGKTKTKQRRKKQYHRGMEWEDKELTMTKKECTLEAEVLVDLDHGSTPFDIL